MHPAELLQGVFRPEVVPIIDCVQKCRTDGTITTAWCGVPWDVADSLATAKSTLQSQQTELQVEHSLDNVGLFWVLGRGTNGEQEIVDR